MNSFEKIKLACKFVGLPAYPDYSETHDDMYVVYNIVDEHPTAFSDDAPRSNLVALQAHLIMDKDVNFFDIQKRLRVAFFNRGFTYPSVSLNTVEDNNKRHIVLEFEDDDENFL